MTHSKTDNKEKRSQPTVSAILPNGTLIEMLYQPQESKTQLCTRQGDEWQVCSSVVDGALRLQPYSPHNNLLQHRVLLLPSHPEAYDSEDTLLSEIRAYVHRYVDLSPLFEEIASYYVLLSWVYDAFSELPYLRFRGDYGCGKTRALLVIGSICYKPIFASGASTVSPLFRMLDSIRGTLIIDEGDFRVSDEKAEIIKILNNGNAKGFPVLRSDVSPKGEINPHAYSIFGPKLVATRRSFNDTALESRCITEDMGQRKLRADIPITLPKQQQEEAERLRNKLLVYRFRQLQLVGPNAIGTGQEMEPRLRQIYTPLLSLIRDPSTREALTRLIKDVNDDLVSDRGMDLEGQVLEVIRDLLHTETARLSVQDITSWFLDRYGEDYGGKLTPKWVGGVIRNKLQLKTRKSNGVYIIPPTEHKRLRWLFKRYGLEDQSQRE